MTEQDTYDMVIEDKAARDLPLLAKKLPAVNVKDVIYRPGRMR